VQELVTPRTTSEKVRSGWTPKRNPRYTTHQITHPSLLDQLRRLADLPRGNGEGGKGLADSDQQRIGGFEAMDRLLAIEAAAAVTVSFTFAGQPRDTPEENLRAIVGYSLRYPGDLVPVARDVRRWRHWAAVAAGWERVFRPDATCPACERRGTLRVHEEQTAVCGGENGCGEAWGPETITLLGAHVKWEQQQARRKPKAGAA
jgi:hypothetical protein